jgi:hypothetical protein
LNKNACFDIYAQKFGEKSLKFIRLVPGMDVEYVLLLIA